MGEELNRYAELFGKNSEDWGDIKNRMGIASLEVFHKTIVLEALGKPKDTTK